MIRAEQASEVEVIEQIHLAAFAHYPGNGTIEAKLVRLLREHDSWIPELSLVAEKDGEVVGHVLLTRATVGEQQVLALGPIGVVPGLQKTGIGTTLMHAAIEIAQRDGERLIALLGDPAYYSRFGFVLGTEVGITSGEPQWAEHFQVLPLTSSSRANSAIRHRFTNSIEVTRRR